MRVPCQIRPVTSLDFSGPVSLPLAEAAKLGAPTCPARTAARVQNQRGQAQRLLFADQDHQVRLLVAGRERGAK